MWAHQQILLGLSALILNSNCVPLIDFNDEWNYELKPQHLALLSSPSPSRNHILPPLSQENSVSIKSNGKKIEARNPKKLGDAVQSRVSCGVCKLGVGLLAKEVNKDKSFEELKAYFVNLCVSFNIESEAVCSGIFNVYGPDVLAAFKTTQIGPVEICSLVLGETCGEIKNPLHEWTIDFPNTQKPNLSRNEIPQHDGLPTFKVLHLSDTHYDPDYQIGSPANCEEPLCCRNYSTPSLTEALEPAGKWGAYKKCDSPKSLIDNMLRNIAETHPDIDYIIWTGDLPAHDIWNQTKEGNMNIFQETVQQMFESFPNTPIFPAIGNHESIPAGSFAPPWMKEKDHSIAWLYNQVVDQWRRWLPASSANTLLHGGFYSVLLRPGFRLISLNTNYCHSLSWWLLVNSTDPAKELKWLVHELQEAENQNEKVHLIGHIPPGSIDCMKVWSRNFYSIVERYEDTILAQFYGHSHADEFEVFYETQEFSRATNIAYLGPSVTTYDNFNPAYRIYYVDGDHANSTREVLDHETYTTNLDEANQSNEDPKWYKLYSARAAYGMKTLRPAEWAKLIERLMNDEDLFELFYKYYYRDSPTRPSCADSKCKLKVLCNLKSAKSHDRHHLCHELELAFGVY